MDQNSPAPVVNAGAEADTLLISPEPAAALTTQEIIADTLTEDALMGAFDSFADAANATQNSTRLTRNNTMAAANISLHQLFGRGYEAILAENDQAVYDPALLDTDAILQDIFGQQTSFVHDAFTAAAASGYHKYQKAIQDAKLADCMSELDECFGPYAEYVKEESGVSIRPNVTMSAAYPAAPSAPAVKAEKADKTAELLNSTLLLTMPTVYPNRQILHFDSNPYNPMTSRPKESNDRKTYTPQNIMMWTYEPKSKQFLSNSRVIQWSDGSTTLHVGAEMYEIETFTDGALSFLGERRHMYRCDKAYSAIIETVPVDNHITVRSRSDKQNSIDFVTATRTAKSMRENVALSVGLPLGGLPAFVGAEGKGGRRSVEEEYVESERTALKKLIADLERKGTPMSRAEQLRRDAQILNDVINIGTGIDSLVAKQQERKRQEDAEKEATRAERELANNAKAGTKRIRMAGGLDGVEKRQRNERKTDRVPGASYEHMAEEAEAAAETIAAEDISGDKWRAVLVEQLEGVREACFGAEDKETVSNTIAAITNLSKEGAATEMRSFLAEGTLSDTTIDDVLANLDTLVARLETE